MLGFNWGEIPRDSNAIKALRIKVVHEGLWQGSTEADLTLNSFLPWGTGLIHADQEVAHGGAAIPYAWAEAFEFDPTISNIGSVYAFTPRVGDTTGAAWGFKMRDTTVMDTVAGTSNDNYRRVLLTADKLQGSNQQKGLPLSTPRLFLANPWPDVLQVNNNWAEIYNTYQSWVHHRDGLNNFMPGSNEMFVRDYRIPNTYFSLQASMYKRDGSGNIVYDSTTGQPIIETHGAGSWLDTAMRPGSITIIHMKGDSTEWWLSANLRRLANPGQNNTPSNAIVMSFRVPFTRRYDTLYYRGSELQSTQKGTVIDTVYARFDSTAVAGDTVVHSHYGCMDKSLAAYDSTVFYIRAGMLPPSNTIIGTENRPDITLSAHFWLPKFEVNDRYKAYQPERVKLEAPPYMGGLGLGLAQVDTTPTTKIIPVVSRINMQVTYHGNVDVGLDWVRYESRLARMILRGHKDTLITRAINKWYKYLDNTAPNKGLFNYGHYLADEASPIYWRTQRHIATLLEGGGTIEGSSNYTGQYNQQTRDRERWISWAGMMYFHATPFIRWGMGSSVDQNANADWLGRDDRSLGLRYGYRGMRYIENGVEKTSPFDLETQINYGNTYAAWQNTPFSDMPDSIYYQLMQRSYSCQASMEQQLIERVLQHRDILYGTTPVWYNTWLYSEWKPLPNKYNDNAQYPRTARFTFNRPLTGEETRVYTWIPLILGGKGLMPYKGGSSWSSGEPRGEFGLTCPPSTNEKTGRRFVNQQGVGSNGGDFLDSYHIMSDYFNASAVSSFMGVPANRIYVGTQTMFEETKRLHSFADDNGSELMRLRLQAVYNKGFKLTESTRDATVNVSNFLNLPYIYLPGTLQGSGGLSNADTVYSGQFNMVRPIHTRTGAAASATTFENWQDSAFYMVTLLKDSSQNIGMDKLFYVGVVNRRVDPTIYRTAAGGTDLGDSVKFYTTVEFDSLRAGNYLNHYASPEYAQAGAREITLPFNYNLSSGYALLHIEEVGGTLDTVIGQDKSLSLMFKPGEGKLLRVNVLKPGEVADGQLDYNGQRKLIAQELPGDSVCYHMAYYRREANGRRKVYYSRSKATARNSMTENITWETPAVLSDSSNGIGTSIKNGDCAYPSIVVRYDSVAGKDRVYVVYACNKTDKDKPVFDGEHHIVENTFLWNTSNASLTKDQKNKGVIIARSQGDVLENWGTPVINASARGNFYAWSDSIMGIGIGYKRPQDTFFVFTIYTRWGVSGDSAQHPSFNSYSRVSSGENSAALVWQENNHIYYARPQHTSVTGLKLQSLASLYTPLNTLRTITRLSDADCCPYNRMPVIYRSLETGSTYTRWGINQPFTRERVFWEGRDSTTATKSRIYRRVLDLGEIAGSYEIWLGASPTPAMISGNFYRLEQPNVVQGKVWYKQQNSDIINMSDSAYTLNFSGNILFQPSSTNRIWHVPLPYGWRQGGQYATNSFGSAVLLDRGQYPNLAAIKDLTPTSDWWVNRRVLQTGKTPDIVSSAQYYYRTIQPKADDALTQMIGYKKGNGSCDRYLIADTYIDNSPLAFYEPQIEIVTHPDTAMVLKADTLKSDWFSIGSTREVSFFGLGTDTSFVGMELVQQSTGARTPVVLKPSVSATTATLVVKTFTNGGGGYYRLEFFKKSTSASFVDDLYVGQLPYDSLGTFTYGKGSASASSEVIRGSIVNLATSGIDETAGLHAYVYPNPAQDVVSISVYRTYSENMAVTGESNNNHVLVRVVSMLGTEVASFDAHTGDEIKLPVKSLPKGVYFVRVEQVGNSQESSTTSFVVE